MFVVGVAAATAFVALPACEGARSTFAPPPPPTTTTTAEPRLDPVVPYQPLVGEPVPTAKQAAADVLQVIGTYERGDGTLALARARLAARGFPPALADSAGVLLDPGQAAAVDVVYPQLGGLTATSASVMTVIRQRVLRARVESAVSRTVDVRLERTGETWAPVALASMGGDPVAVPAGASALARSVLDNPNLDLPDSARWDIAAGRIDTKVLQLLSDLAAEHQLRVTVLASGHPPAVFGRRLTSNHTRGRAVDIWAVDGTPVIQQRDPAGPLGTLVRQLRQRGVTELGAPFALAGSFSDTVHQDHLHLGFDA